MMSVKYFSHFTILFLATALLFLAACDNRDKEMVEKPVEGALLTNGPVPPISDQGAMKVRQMLTNMHMIKQYEFLLKDGFASVEELLRKNRARRAQEEGRELSEEEIPDLDDFDAFWAKHVVQEGTFNVENRADHYLVTFPNKTIIDLSTNKDAPAETAENSANDSDTEDAASMNRENKLIFTHDLSLRVRPTGDPNAWRVEAELSDIPVTFSVLKRFPFKPC